MPEYLAPGVYVEEIDTGSKPIEGVSTSTAGMIGVTERGPVNVPILLTSLGDYTRWFGERLSFLDFAGHCFTPLAVEGFFTNGGKRLYLTRILDTAGATSAAGELYDHGTPTGADTMILRAAGELSGTLAPGPLVYVLDTSDLSVGDSVRIGDGSRSEYRLIAAAPDVTNNKHVPLSFPLAISHAAGTTVEEFAVAADAGLYQGRSHLPSLRRPAIRLSKSVEQRLMSRLWQALYPSRLRLEARQPASIAIPAS